MLSRCLSRVHFYRIAFYMLSLLCLAYITYVFYDFVDLRQPIYAYNQPISGHETVLNPAPVPKTFWKPPESSKYFENVTILMWTKYYGGNNLVSLIHKDSPVPDWCQVTFNKSLLNSSKAIVFNMLRNDFMNIHLPTRDPSQIWVYFVLESPANVVLPKNSTNGLFNRTMTYRLDSDYPCPYGYITKRHHPLAENPYYSDPKFPRNKTKLIAWMVSHCKTSSNREYVVSRMRSSGLPIDTYGSCGNYSCNISQQNQELGCYQKLGQTYKFYLSFENSICRDYVSEKFSNALFANMVPIVYGGSDYESLLPKYPKPGYINVKDFKNSKDLADHLLYLDKNETAYAEYFEWRRYYHVHARQGFGGFKKICYDLQKDLGENNSYQYEDIYKWWVTDANCVYDWPKDWK